jgi:4-amino-4-deoxy-L-arabinose transferase-like glycosyltransferase
MNSRFGYSLSLLLILGIGAWFRFYHLDFPPLTDDEAVSWRINQFPLWETVQRTGDDANPPLYYVVLRGWMRLCGDSLLAMRALSALLGLLSILGIYGLVRELLAAPEGPTSVGPSSAHWTALLAAGLLAVCPFQVLYHRSMRAYALGVCLAVLSSWALIRAVRTGKVWWWLAYGVLAVLFAYTHYYAFFTLAAQALYVIGVIGLSLIFDRRRATGLVGGSLIATILFLAAYAPWISYFGAQSQAVRIWFWIPRLTVATVTDLMGRLFTGFPLGEVGGAAIGLLVLTGAGYLALTRGRLWGFLALLVLVPWGSAILASLVVGRNILYDRYLLFAHTFYLASLAILVASIPNLKVRGIVLVGVAFNLVVAICFDTELYPLPDNRFPELCRRLRADAPGRQFVIAQDPQVANRLGLYLSHAGIEVRLKTFGTLAAASGHQLHAASIPTEEWLSRGDLDGLPERMVWTVGFSPIGFVGLPRHWSVRRFEQFRNANGGVLYLIQWDIMSRATET